MLNQQGELLCNLRHPSKDVFSSLWDVNIGGHLDPHESYEACAIRELQEELGVAVSPDELYFMGVVSVDGWDAIRQLYDREHAGVFVWQTDLFLSDFRFQTDEINALRFWPLPEVKNLLQHPHFSFPFVPLEAYLTLLDQILAHLQKNNLA